MNERPGVRIAQNKTGQVPLALGWMAAARMHPIMHRRQSAQPPAKVADITNSISYVPLSDALATAMSHELDRSTKQPENSKKNTPMMTHRPTDRYPRLESIAGMMNGASASPVPNKITINEMTVCMK
jgi:hypothetical protein